MSLHSANIRATPEGQALSRLRACGLLSPGARVNHVTRDALALSGCLFASHARIIRILFVGVFVAWIRVQKNIRDLKLFRFGTIGFVSIINEHGFTEPALSTRSLILLRQVYHLTPGYSRRHDFRLSSSSSMT